MTTTLMPKLKIEKCGDGVRIANIVTVKNEKVIDEEGRKVYPGVPSHERHYEDKIGGATTWRRRSVETLFRGTKYAPDGIPVGFTEHCVKREDGDFKTTSSVCDIIPEERTKLLHLLDGKLYLTHREKQVDAARKAEARAMEETYGKDAVKAGARSTESMIQTIRESENFQGGMQETIEQLKAQMAEMQAELQRRRGGRPRKDEE